MSDNDLQQTLDRLLNELKSNEPQRCLSAIQELMTLNASSKAIIAQLEKLALGEVPEVESAALNALSLKISQVVASKQTSLTPAERGSILREINKWQDSEILDPVQAEVLRRRYDFDIQPAYQAQAAQPIGAQPDDEIEPLEIQAPSMPSTSVAPRASLIQTLLSEASIKVYLYLGAFFVIASALILAAVVEAARLPILAGATIAFGGAALALHKRLPQPSFALFIVFSFLLPIDANVFEETVGIVEPSLSIYWTVIFFLMALIWGFSVWFYESRLFSTVAFVALSLGFYRAGQIFDAKPELLILLGLLASLAGLAFTLVLKKWKGNAFPFAVFALSQLQALLLLSLSLVLPLLMADTSGGQWLLIALTWIAAASFYAASDILFPFFLFPWMAVGALLPLPWFVLNAFDVSQPIYAIGFWFWATIIALASEAVLRSKWQKLERYQWALLVGSLPVFITSALIALDWDKPTLTFALLAGTTLVYASLHILRPRWYVWSVALLYAVSAYFVLFAIPLIEQLNIAPLFQLLGASILLTVPELFARTSLSFENQSRLPAIILGVTVAFITALVALLDSNAARTAIVFLTFAILLSLHAFHFRRPWIGYFACAAEVLTVVYGLHYYKLDLWLPAVALLSVLYYAAGFSFRQFVPEFREWGVMFVNAGLGLGVLLSGVSLALTKETAGWYILMIALLFVVEIFARPLAWLEIIVELLLSLSLYMTLNDFDPPYVIEHFLFGVSLIWLGGDLILSRVIEKRPHRPLTVGVGYLLLAASSIGLWVTDHRSIPIFYFLLYAIFFAVYAITQREPRLGYFVTAFIPLAVIEFYQCQDLEKWIFPVIALATLYYAVGFVLRQKQRLKGWDNTLLYSGLGLGVITSIASPFQGGLSASVPVAIAATLFAVEAFAQRNVWLAFPANALYLMSYFVILAELHVDEPQYYSIGAALLGMLMHYLLTRAGSRASAFAMGMLSQIVLLGTTYIQMVSANELKFFFVLFVQSMVVLVYGLIQRSRSLVITPIVFAVLGVVTVVYSALKGLSSVILIGCTGIILLLLGIGAVLLRERITRLGEHLSDWKP